MIVFEIQIKIITNTLNLNTKICLNDLNDQNKKQLMQKTVKKKL